MAENKNLLVRANLKQLKLPAMGAEFEKRVQAAAKEFSDGAAELFREALEARLRSDEGRALLSQITDKAFAHLMDAKLADCTKMRSATTSPRS